MPFLPRRIWSDEDWYRTQLGYCFRDMDEKWDVFVEDHVVFPHRSWTGHGVFEATFAPADGGGRQIAEAVAERDLERYRGDDEYDCLTLELVLSAIVLGEPSRELRKNWWSRPDPEEVGSTDVPAWLVRHSTLGLRADS
ncbi:hypothetical protein [Embleya sp. NPDC005575]|uniref:hypothetical protein n=1 Tax=Embleya sp. NPDC005575 TaxID=3156892 RepID=UPI0033A252C8